MHIVVFTFQWRPIAHFNFEIIKTTSETYFSTLQNAEQDDLFAILNEQAEIDTALPEGYTIKSVMDTWTLQSGYPVLFVGENTDASQTQQFELRQVGSDKNHTSNCQILAQNE